MYGALLALMISLLMIAMIIFKGRKEYPYALWCKKSELASIIDTLSDDAVIEIRIGRNSYEHTTGNLS